jgi:hypothetical protein
VRLSIQAYRRQQETGRRHCSPWTHHPPLKALEDRAVNKVKTKRLKRSYDEEVEEEKRDDDDDEQLPYYDDEADYVTLECQSGLALAISSLRPGRRPGKGHFPRRMTGRLWGSGSHGVVFSSKLQVTHA